MRMPFSTSRGWVHGLQEGVINDLVLLSAVGVRPVMVHGGGPEINIWLNKLGIEAQFKDGLRVTDGGHLVSIVLTLQQLECSGI